MNSHNNKEQPQKNKHFSIGAEAAWFVLFMIFAAHSLDSEFLKSFSNLLSDSPPAEFHQKIIPILISSFAFVGTLFTGWLLVNKLASFVTKTNEGINNLEKAIISEIGSLKLEVGKVLAGSDESIQKEIMEKITALKAQLKAIETLERNVHSILVHSSKWEQHFNGKSMSTLHNYREHSLFFVRVLSHVIGTNAYNIVTKHEDEIKHGIEKRKKIEVSNYNPVYDSMEVAANYIKDGSVYIATTKLRSYGDLNEGGFLKFFEEMNNKTSEDRLFVIRLFYIPRTNTLSKDELYKRISKINKISPNNEQMVSHYILLDIDDFNQATDMAFIYEPKKQPLNRNEFNDLVELTSTKNTQHQTTQKPHTPSLFSLLNDKDYEEQGLIEYHLSKKMLSVEKITFYLPQETKQSYEEEKKKEFNDNWSTSTNISEKPENSYSQSQSTLKSKGVRLSELQ